MSKAEFLHALQGRLAEILPREKVEEHVRYYESYIIEETRQGKTEEEVLEELGDPLLIAKTIMDTSEEDSQQQVFYEETAGDTGNEERWEDRDPRIRHYELQTKGGCLLAAIIIVVVIALILWLVGSVISFLLPVLIPLVIILLVVAYFKQR
ncbi:MAG: DUF1700 domain-containing protein [Oliverpabstia sp.]